jgi:ectoine hydroxylase-related dioxygenase (phytanoyl-CoA dioxygenase family)
MTNDIRDFYRVNGFYIHQSPILDASLITAAREGVDQVIAGDYDTGNPPEESSCNSGGDPQALYKIELPQKANRAIWELIRSSQIGECVAAATGATMVQVWWVQLLFKPPTPKGKKAKTNVGWHQDWSYWDSTWKESSELLTAGIALSNVSEKSGPMKLVPGSHQWKNPGGGDFFSQDIDQSIGSAARILGDTNVIQTVRRLTTNSNLHEDVIV